MSYRHQATDIITVTWILYHSDCRENHLFGVTLGHKTKMVYDDSTVDTSNYCLFENPLNYVTVFENHRKGRIVHCKRSELRLHVV